MKLKIILISFLFLSFVAKSFSQSVDENSLPPAVKKAFNAKFQVTGTPDWTKSDEGYVVEFYIGNLKGNATYKEDGTFVKSDTETEPENVPEAVRNYIDNTFKGFKIDYARKYEFFDKKENYYYVTAPKILKDGKKYIPEFSISTQGKMINETVPPELEPYRLKGAPTVSKEPVEKEKTSPKGKTIEPKTTANKKPADKTSPSPKQPVKKGGKETSPKQSFDSSIPEPATDHFTKKFKLATDVKWDTQENNYIANCLMKGQKTHVYYAKDGSFEKSQADVNPKALPPTINKTLTTNYPGQKVVSVENTLTADNQKYYEIILTQKKDKQTLNTTVWTNMTGQVIKEILPEGANKEEESQLADNTVPQIVKDAFTAKYPKVPNVKWEKLDANYAASFFFKGEKMISEYTDAAEWLHTTKVVPAAKLPPPVQKYVHDKHGSEKMITTQFVETSEKQKYYYIETRSDARKNKPAKTSKFKVSAAGKLIEDVSDNDEPETQPVKEPEKKSVDKPKVETNTNTNTNTNINLNIKSQEEIDKENELKAKKKAEEDLKKAELEQKKAAEEQKKLEEKAKKEQQKKLKKKKKEDEDIDKEFEKDFGNDTIKKPAK